MTTIGQGLNIAGAALAQALMQRKMQKRRETRIDDLINALRPHAFPEQIMETPDFQGALNLADAMIPQAPMQAMSPMDPAKDPMRGVSYMDARRQIEGRAQGVADEQNQKRQLMKALLMTGSPQAEQIALQIGGLGPKQKPMSVTGGYLDSDGEFHRTEQVKPDYSRFDVITVGDEDQLVDYSRTDESGAPLVLKSGKDLKSKDEVWTDAGGEMEQGWIRDPRSGQLQPMQLPDGSPAVRRKSGGTTVNVNTGDQPSLMGDAPFLRKAQADIAAAQGAVLRIARIEELFHPFFQSMPGQVTTWTLGMFDRLLPKGLPAGKAKNLLSAKTSFAQYTNENMNLYIKMITGAQMSEAEASRLSKAIANLGDSPTQFATKLANSKTVLEEAAKILEEELQFYAGVEGMDYEEALEYARKRAANHIRLGLADIESQAGEYDAMFGGKGGGGSQTPEGLTPAPKGYRYRQIGPETWELVKE